MVIKISGSTTIHPFIKKLYIPPADSHKGQNGKMLVVGGSSLFHAASMWAAQVATYFVDFVHYASTSENNKVMLSVKKSFRGGIVVARQDILSYVEEDDVILIGPGMMRAQGAKSKIKNQKLKFSDILKIEDDATYTYAITKFLLQKYPHKQFVLDAGALQMMETSWLKNLKTPAIITPHIGEFAILFGTDLRTASQAQKIKAVGEMASSYHCVVLLKAIDDYVSDGKTTVQVVGGNAGLTKGGTGDVLAGLTAALAAKNAQVDSCVAASYILKATAQRLSLTHKEWYNIDSIIGEIPRTLADLTPRT